MRELEEKPSGVTRVDRNAYTQQHTRARGVVTRLAAILLISPTRTVRAKKRATHARRRLRRVLERDRRVRYRDERTYRVCVYSIFDLSVDFCVPKVGSLKLGGSFTNCCPRFRHFEQPRAL